MIKGKKIFYYFGIFLLASLVANGICYFYYNIPISTANHEKFTSAKYVPSDHNVQGTEGYGNISIDANGFNNQVDFAIDEAEILFIGSSQTEARQVDTNKNYVSIINQEYPAAKAYNLGISGEKFSSIFFRIKPLKEKFPHAKVFVFEMNAMPSLADLQNIETLLSEDNIDNMPGKAMGWRNNNPVMLKATEMIPIVRLLKWNYFLTQERKKDETKGELKIELDADAYEQQLRRVLLLGKEKAGTTEIIIFNLAHTKLNQAGDVEIIPDKGENEIFQKVCSDISMTYIDMAEPFREAYKKEHVLPYGFLNSPIGTGHLNQYGHRIIANTLEKVLKDGAYIR